MAIVTHEFLLGSVLLTKVFRNLIAKRPPGRGIKARGDTSGI